MRRRGFSLVEILAGVAIISIVVAVPLSLRFATLSEEEAVAREAEKLASWLDNVFLRAQATKQKFTLYGSGAESGLCQIKWSRGGMESYAAGGGVKFLNQTSDILLYSPIKSSNQPYGLRIMVYIQRQSVARFVVVSRFARVRVDKTAY